MNRFLLIVFVILSIQSCNKDEEHTSILGSWNCEEFSDIYGQRTYQTNISRNLNIPDSTSEYVIYNFHKLGLSEATEVYVREIEPGEFTITGTASIGHTFTGKGIIAPDFSTINWNYQVNDGGNNPLVIANYY